MLNREARRALWIALLLALAACASIPAQQIPQGVAYKKASAAVNAQAKTALEQALAGPGAPALLKGDAISCGPMLWRDLADHHDALAKDSTPVTMILSVPEPAEVEGRGFRTQAQRELFWQLTLEKFPELRKGVVRPAEAGEIQYYWATIPFDIEEPLFTIETPHALFIANLRVIDGEPVLFWLDRIDDLRTLKK